MNRSLTAHPVIWGSEAPYAPGFLGQSGIGLTLPTASDVLDQYVDRAYEPADLARKHSSLDEGFSFASYPSGVSSWNLPTPELADGSSHYSSSMSMSRSASMVSSYPGPSSYVPGSSLYGDNDLFVPHKMQFSYMGAFDPPISPTNDFLTGHSLDLRNMPSSPLDMSRTMSSSSSGSHDLLTGITGNESATPSRAEYPRRRGARPSYSGRSSSNTATAGGSPAPQQPPPNQKLKIPRAARASSPARGRHHKLLCDKCDRTPQGFRGDHELMRHKRLFHSKRTLKWVCADLRAEAAVVAVDDWSAPKLGLDQCPNCRNGKQYGQYYNAAAQ